MIFLTRHEHFNAAHKLYNPGWSEEKNIEVLVNALMQIGMDIIII